MTKATVYNWQGDKTGEVELSSRIFGVKVKPEVVHQVVLAQMANARQVLAHTKTKGEVRGGGKKPWRQKGTGRARHGSIRSPLWKGGGVIFGPRNDRNFSQKINKKQKQLALAMCLSDKLSEQAAIFIDQLQIESGKTKDLSQKIKGLQGKNDQLKAGKKFLLVLPSNDEKTIKAALNLKNVNTILADSLNCQEVLRADRLIIAKDAVQKIEKHYSRIKAAKK